MMVISVLWTIYSFFAPLNIFVEITTIAAGLAAFSYFSNYRFISFKKNLSFVAAIILILFAGSFHPYILDHFGYYVPTIKWLSEFGIVKGIANLEIILGQMSFWHVLQAGFSNFTDSFLRLNSVLLIVFLIYIFEKKSWVNLIFLPFFLMFSQQPSPDMPVFVFSLIIMNEILRKNTNHGNLMLLAVFVFAIKPTAIWLPLLVFLYSALILKANVKSWIPAVMILALFFFKNLWTFGYPIYPVQVMDMHLPWKPAPEVLKNSAQLAVEKTYDLQYSYNAIRQFSLWEHFKNWFLLKGIKGKIHLFFIISLLIFALFTFYKKNRIITLVFFSILVKSILVLLFSAQYRFFMDVFFAIGFVMLYKSCGKKKSFILFWVFSLIIGIIFVFPKIIQTHVPSFNLGFAMGGFQKNQVYKPSVYTYNHYRSYRIGNLKFNVVENYPFSFNTALPAVSPGFLLEYDEAGIFPQKNTQYLKDGFHWRKLTVAEHRHLKKIIADIQQRDKKIK